MEIKTTHIILAAVVLSVVMAGAVYTGVKVTGMGVADPDSVCGNGLLEGAEECDDGNIVAGDGCDANCIYWDDMTANPSCPGEQTGVDIILKTEQASCTGILTAHPKVMMGVNIDPAYVCCVPTCYAYDAAGDTFGADCLDLAFDPETDPVCSEGYLRDPVGFLTGSELFCLQTSEETYATCCERDPCHEYGGFFPVDDEPCNATVGYAEEFYGFPCCVPDDNVQGDGDVVNNDTDNDLDDDGNMTADGFLCNDTDGGAVNATAGTVNISNGSVYADVCVDTSLLVEFYCGVEAVGYEAINCSSVGMVCEDGACVDTTAGASGNDTVNDTSDNDTTSNGTDSSSGSSGTGGSKTTASKKTTANKGSKGSKGTSNTQSTQGGAKFSPSSLAPTMGGSEDWYMQWWAWAAAGGLVLLIGGGITAGVVLKRKKANDLIGGDAFGGSPGLPGSPAAPVVGSLPGTGSTIPGLQAGANLPAPTGAKPALQPGVVATPVVPVAKAVAPTVAALEKSPALVSKVEPIVSKEPFSLTKEAEPIDSLAPKAQPAGEKVEAPSVDNPVAKENPAETLPKKLLKKPKSAAELELEKLANADS